MFPQSGIIASPLPNVLVPDVPAMDMRGNKGKVILLLFSAKTIGLKKSEKIIP
jgi:hypothetical protein